MKNIQYAIKFIRRQPFNNIIRLLSITFGLFMGIVCLAWVTYQFSYDKIYSDWERIYQLWSISPNSRSNSFNEQIAPLLKEELPKIEAVTRSLEGYYSTSYKYQGEDYTASNLFVDTSYFDIFDFGIISGDAHSIFVNDDNIMISKSFAKKVFKDDNPIGKVIEDNKSKRAFTVMGIYKDMPLNNHRGKHDILRSITRFTKDSSNIDSNQRFYTYLKLQEGISVQEIEGEMEPFIKRHNINSQERFDSKTTWILNPITYSVNNGFAYFPIHIIALFIAILTLLVACLNYILLSMSILIKRTKTIGMLKCSGANKGDIFKVTLWENIFLILIGTFLSALLIYVFSNKFSQMMYLPIKELFCLSNIWSSILVISTAIVFIGLVNGIMSAKIPAKAALLWKSSGNQLWKKIFLFLQILISTTAIVFLIYISIQIDRMENKDLGYSKENLFHFSAFGDSQSLNFLKSEIESIPGVNGSVYTSDILIYGWKPTPCYDENSREPHFYCRRLNIDQGYLDFMGIKLIAGKDISTQGGSVQVLINEKYAKEMGWSAEESLGKNIFQDKNLLKPYVIVGVVKDFRMGEYGVFRPCVLHPMEYGENGETWTEMIIRSDGLSSSTYKAISEKLEKVLKKDISLYSYSETHRVRLAYEIAIQQVLILASIVCLFITVMGLIGFIGEEMARRRKEIAIRKINGASSLEIIIHIIKGTIPFSIPPVIIALIASYIGGGFLIIDFPADNRAPLSWWIFLTGAVVVLAVITSVVVFRCLKTVRENPIDAIKE